MTEKDRPALNVSALPTLRPWESPCAAGRLRASLRLGRYEEEPGRGPRGPGVPGDTSLPRPVEKRYDSGVFGDSKAPGWGVLEPDQVPRDMRMGCRGAGQGRQGICKESKSKLYSEPALSPMNISVHTLRSFFTHVYYLTYETGAIYQGPLKIFTF